jgi:hypothetical protein
MARVVACASAAVLALVSALIAANEDFSGTWIGERGQTLSVTQQGNDIHCSLTNAGSVPTTWSYHLTGQETRYRLGAELRNSIVKWEGAALLVNTLVSGPRDYTEMDRWRISPDRTMLTISRQTVSNTGTVETRLVYRREGVSVTPRAGSVPAAVPAPLRREPPPPATDFLVTAGTHVGLAFRNAVDTKHSREGDHIYLETVAPIAVGGRVVIPRGSFVNGTITGSKAAGALKGKGELYIRFDTLILPNGTTRDFRSHLVSTDASAQGKVDPKEGKVTGERNSSGEARGTAEGAGIGGTVGGVAGAASGHPITGLGAGAGAGAAAGLASVLVKHRPDVSLPRGTVVDMVLDRDLHLSSSELPT